jgi:hypothetical protein
VKNARLKGKSEKIKSTGDRKRKYGPPQKLEIKAISATKKNF